MPQITITLSDEEYQKYLNGLAMAKNLNPEYQKILLIFNSPGCQIPMVRAPLPQKSEPLLDGWRSVEHNVFYRQAIRQANAILREG